MDNKVYILGGAQTDFERNWTKEGKNVIALLKEVVEDTLKATGLTYERIIELNKQGRIACFVGNFCAEYYVNQGHLGALLTEVNPAFYGVPSARYEADCASGSVALDAAISKIKSKDYDVAIVIGWEMMKTVDAKIGGDFLGRAALYEKEGRGVDFPFPKLFGQLADQIIQRNPKDEERVLNGLAQISAINYENGKRNPNAQTRKWFMSQSQASQRGTDTNPAIGGKLAISDCSQVTDGAAAIILATEDYVKENYEDRELPIVKGWGHRVAPMVFENKIQESSDHEYILPWTRQTVVDAYNRANLTTDDIDFFETHDCFTSSEYAAISAFGITEPGKEYEAIEAGRIAFNGDKPINPSGGLIGCGHPVGASGVRMFLDLYKQVTNTAGSYQIPNAKNGMMLNIGGSATTNYVFIIGKNS
ncbi:MAG: thiolase domain-containing protein [Clostridiales bacterium]|nr:thiolase domain-containing protein [Clostridiales bacterium]